MAKILLVDPKTKLVVLLFIASLTNVTKCGLSIKVPISISTHFRIDLSFVWEKRKKKQQNLS